MSDPRRLVRDQVHALVRRTTDLKPLLCPDERTLAILRYNVILIASRYQASVEVTALTFLSTHSQGVFRDLLGGEHSRLPDFQRDLHSNIARSLNARHQRGGAFWEAGTYANTEIHGDAAELAQMLYMWTQAVIAGLVERPEEWPGTLFLPEDIGRVIVVRRPDDAWFGSERGPGSCERALVKAQAQLEEAQARRRKRGKQSKKGKREAKQAEKLRTRVKDLSKQAAAERRAELEAQRARSAGKPHAKPQERRRPKQGRSTLPERVEYLVPVPHFLRHLPLEEARRVLREALEAELKRIHAERHAQGWHQVIGLERALSVNPHQGKGDPMPEFALCPKIACAGVTAQERNALYEEQAAWRQRHKEEVEVLESQHPHRANFPPGTYRRAQEVTRLRRMRSPPQAA